MSETVYFNPEELLEQLTLDEKIDLLTAKDYWHTVPIPRLSIPSIKVTDGPGGSRGSKRFNSTKTAAFPCGTALGSTFDKKLLFEVGKLMAIEAQHKGAHVILGPTTNIQRGPLGGRGFESVSEDPFLSGIVASNIVNGIQDSGKVGATMKHFVCNDMEMERFAYDVQVSDRALREIYLEPFRLAVKNADPKLFMTAYNKIQGVHASTSEKLLKTILREEWNSSSVIISDWYGSSHPMTSIKSGLDIDFPGPQKFRSNAILKHLLFSNAETRDGSVFTEDDINERVLKILTLIEHFVKAYGTTDFDFQEDTENNIQETALFLRKVAAESIVLLKNEDNILPLNKTDDIVVIGPNAKAKYHAGGGSAFINAYYVVSPYEGIVKAVGKNVPYSKGCDTHKSLSWLIEDCKTENNQIGMTVKFYKKSDYKTSGEKPFRTEIVDASLNFMSDLRDPNIDVIERLFYCDWEGFYTAPEDGVYELGCQVTGTAIIYINDKLVLDNRTNQTKGSFYYGSGTIEEKATFNMVKGETYKIRIDFGSVATSKLEGGGLTTCGGLKVGINRLIDPEEEIQRAKDLAAKHAKVVLIVGLNNEFETEGEDRSNMDLPALTNKLITEVLKSNPNTVVVNQSGTPISAPWIDHCKVFLQTYYGGNELGNAIADVLFGNVNPSAKLSVTWPKKVQDNPSFLNFKSNMGRVIYGEDIYVGYKFYEEVEREVEFPFGYGLSYTAFTLSNLSVGLTGDKKELDVSVTLTNTGDKRGAEVVQVYTQRKSPSAVQRVNKELKEFEKVVLNVGESKSVTFKLSVKDSCSYFDEIKNKWHLEAGDYNILVGNSSANVPLVQSFTVEKKLIWSGL
ncbi:hypothetical protein QEN19_003117 [Hanseniaspora menglaensis]